ncbi:helix-turn-helix domain-containing protein [Streptomyces sp. NPDC017936]|uniref:helix-turn-helix domain-containing protein n=1 Tax=Streptomyces sp. NPDC017936 TaxID=3365016 RepID=UPI0037A1A68E
MSAADFAELLRELKERSGLSYGTLAKRLHMSTSTLHRYCNGDAVPTDYAPVERLARLCRATPGELVELHRRWVLADAGRGRKGSDAAGGGSAASPGTAGGTERAASPAAGGTESGPAGATAASAGAAAEPAGAVDGIGGADAAAEADQVVAGPVRGADGRGGADPGQDPGVRRRPRLLAAVAAATALGAVALALSLSLPGGGADDEVGERPAGAVSVQGTPGAGGVSPSASVTSSPSASPSPSAASPSASPTPSGTAARAGAGAAAPDEGDSAPALTVAVRPYAWEDPCSQRYLVDREPGRVKAPPVEQDAPGWVAAYGAVSSGQQLVEVTVQGTGDETVVVDGLKVRTVEKRSPLAWNDFAMGYPGVGCGGGVPKRYFTVALDAARPALVPEAGQDDFPFKVSESDPETYYVSADASAYDVRWVLELSWSSGSRHGTLTVDDEGKPFRTSGNNGRPAYEFPLGGSAWERAGASATP